MVFFFLLGFLFCLFCLPRFHFPFIIFFSFFFSDYFFFLFSFFPLPSNTLYQQKHLYKNESRIVKFISFSFILFFLFILFVLFPLQFYFFFLFDNFFFFFLKKGHFVNPVFFYHLLIVRL